jgi:hypothetical protein
MKTFRGLSEQLKAKPHAREEQDGRFKSAPARHAFTPKPLASPKIDEDLRNWFDKDHPDGGWKRINSKGEAIGPCAREPGEAKPKCMSNKKRAQLSKKERASAVATKRKHDPNPERKGEPINVSNFGKGKISEDMENLEEKNVPTSPEKWAQAKSQAKAKFDVYPSAYANGWAAKKYKEMGGGWKSVSEAVKDKFDIGEYDQEGDMAKSDLRSIIANAQKMHDMLEDNDNLPEWVQSKITKAEDYISTVANYMAAEMSEEVELSEQDDKFSRYMPENDKKPPFDGPYTKTKGTVTDKSGAKHTPMSRARSLARDAMKKVSLGSPKKKMDESRQADIVREAVKAAKVKNKDDKKNGTKDKFEAEPELTSQIVTTSNQ